MELEITSDSHTVGDVRIKGTAAGCFDGRFLWFPEGKLLAFWASTEEWKFG